MKTLMCALFAVISMAAVVNAQVSLHQLRIGPNGHLRQITVDVYEYRIILNANGVIIAVEIQPERDRASSYEIDLRGVQPGSFAGRKCEFWDGKLDRIDDITIRYAPFGSLRVEKIGSFEFQYMQTGGHYRLESVDNIGIEYEIGSDRLKRIGNSTLEYEGVSAVFKRVVTRPGAAAPPVSVILPVGEFRQ